MTFHVDRCQASREPKPPERAKRRPATPASVNGPNFSFSVVGRAIHNKYHGRIATAKPFVHLGRGGAIG